MNNYSLIANITDKTLAVIDVKGGVAAVFSAIFGRCSKEGTKEKEGDQRTPKGRYRICTINEKSQFTLFFGISYPGPKDAEKALQEGRISSEEYRRIIDADTMKTRPPWDTALGGQVGIHGGGIHRDGTRGCIGLTDEDILKLGEYVFLGMEVLIE